jgi:flavin-dependent dehydrogenase
MPEQYDALVVGARCAGAATAMLLARRGYRVGLLDRAAFPSDTVSGHCLLYEGTRRLAAWGLLQAVVDTGCPPLRTFGTDAGDFLLAAAVPTPDGLPVAIGPRRSILDALLVNAAQEAGAELITGTSVDGLVAADGTVRGVRATVRGGSSAEFHARIVIGADGKHSTVARLVRAPAYREEPSLTCWYYAYWEGVPVTGLEVHTRNRRGVFCFPTHEGLTLIAVAWPHDEFARVRGDIEHEYLEAVRAMPSLDERFVGAGRAERFYGMADLPNFFRCPYGPGWALVGDAGHHTDPMRALGMSHAFHDADLLCDAIDAGLSGRMPLETALRRYHAARDERAIPLHEGNLDAARLAPTPAPALALRAALHGDEEETGRMYAARLGVTPFEEYFNPEHLAQVMQRMQARGSAVAVTG